MANYTENTKKNTDVHQQMPAQNLTHKMVREDTQHKLWERTKQLPIENEIKKRKCRWMGHTLRKPATNNTRQSLTWNPQGKRTIGRPRNTRQRDTENERKKMGYTGKEMEKMATNRQEWMTMVDGLCSQRANRPK